MLSLVLRFIILVLVHSFTCEQFSCVFRSVIGSCLLVALVATAMLICIAQNAMRMSALADPLTRSISPNIYNARTSDGSMISQQWTKKNDGRWLPLSWQNNKHFCSINISTEGLGLSFLLVLHESRGYWKYWR